MAFKPLGITVEEAESEVREAWSSCYSPESIAASMDWLGSKSFADRLIHFFSRLAFRKPWTDPQPARPGRDPQIEVASPQAHCAGAPDAGQAYSTGI